MCTHALASGAVRGSDIAAAQRECLSSLRQLVAANMTTREQILNDPDFSQAKQEDWFSPVLASEAQ